MKREGKALLHEIDTDMYYCVKEKDVVVDGYLHDTYTEYGIMLDEAEAEDYYFGNYLFENELCCHLQEKFEKLQNATFYVRAFEIFDYELEDDEELSEEEQDEISKEIEKWTEDNKSYTKATYYTYWDGSNWKSIIIDGDWWEIVEDKDLFNQIFDDFEEAEEKEERNGIRYFEGKEYTHRISRWQSNPFYFESEEK